MTKEVLLIHNGPMLMNFTITEFDENGNVVKEEPLKVYQIETPADLDKLLNQAVDSTKANPWVDELPHPEKYLHSV